MDYIKLTPPTPITIPPMKPPGKSRCYPGSGAPAEPVPCG